MTLATPPLFRKSFPVFDCCLRSQAVSNVLIGVCRALYSTQMASNPSTASMRLREIWGESNTRGATRVGTITIRQRHVPARDKYCRDIAQGSHSFFCGGGPQGRTPCAGCEAVNSSSEHFWSSSKRLRRRDTIIRLRRSNWFFSSSSSSSSSWRRS